MLQVLLPFIENILPKGWQRFAK